MRTVSMILFLLLFISCIKQESISSKNGLSLLYQNWLFTVDIKNINLKGKIEKPKGIELLLAEIKVKKSSSRIDTNCLYYKTPIQDKLGVLTIVEIEEQINCPITPNGKIILSHDHISDFEAYLEQFDLKMKFKIGNEVKNWNFPFYNLKLGSIHEKYKAEREIKKLNGFTILPFDFDPKIDRNGKGGKADRFSTKTAIKCKRINHTCETVGEDFCDLCNFGSYEVVDFGCPNGGSRYCGINHCGEKNEPACIKGKMTEDNEIDGICNEGLTPILNENHELVCQ